MRRFFSLFVLLFWICLEGHADSQIRFAIISDTHVQDTVRLRTMSAQLHSTRLFNENYFAFISALDDVVRRGIRYVILTGDLTDNGQLANVKLVDQILAAYSSKYGFRFFIMTGNHDPARPIRAYIPKDGMPWGNVLGYPEVHQLWSRYGFMPNRQYLYWSTPFSRYGYREYTFARACQTSSWQHRIYRYKGLEPAIHDGSYVVEPVSGVWLLAIDASVYDPVKVEGDSIVDFTFPSSGYNEVLQVRKYLLPWLKKVASDAKRFGKRLIAFSHYPMVDYNSGAAQFVQDIAAAGRFDIDRFPRQDISETLADVGITLHFGGHIHLNDDSLYVSRKGNQLRNVQTPSTAGYAPAYKIVAIEPDGATRITTVPLDTVVGFDHFFSRYRAEYDSLKRHGLPLWNDSILLSRNYREFCAWHLRELVRLRYLPVDLKPDVASAFVKLSAAQLFTEAGLLPEKNMFWTGFDFLVDVYKLRFGFWLAYADIPTARMSQYKTFIKAILKSDPNTSEGRFVYALCRLADAKFHYHGEN